MWASGGGGDTEEIVKLDTISEGLPLARAGVRRAAQEDSAEVYVDKGIHRHPVPRRRRGESPISSDGDPRFHED
jgi:hypothetical protein